MGCIASSVSQSWVIFPSLRPSWWTMVLQCTQLFCQHWVNIGIDTQCRASEWRTRKAFVVRSKTDFYPDFLWSSPAYNNMLAECKKVVRDFGLHEDWENILIRGQDCLLIRFCAWYLIKKNNTFDITCPPNYHYLHHCGPHIWYHVLSWWCTKPRQRVARRYRRRRQSCNFKLFFVFY